MLSEVNRSSGSKEWGYPAESACIELFAPLNPIIASLSRFAAHLPRFWALSGSIFGRPGRVIENSGVLSEVKYVELGLNQFHNWAESAKNELYAGFNRYIEGLSTFAALFLLFWALSGSISSQRFG